MKKLLPFLLGRSINLLAILFPKLAGKIGFKLFCYPFRGTLKGFHHNFLESAFQSTLRHGDLDIKVYQWKNGKKKILFLHGWQSHTFRWKNYIENFPGTDYTLYAIDAPGHGLSSGKYLTVPLYSEIVEKFILEQGGVDAIVSHSLGSFTTLYTIYRRPLLPVGKLVLLASPGEATEFISFYQKTLGLTERSVQRISEYFKTVIKEPIEFFSAPKFATTVTVPGLVIHDEDDDETSYQNSVAVHKAWKKSQLKITKGLSHNLKSPEIVQMVSDFILEESPEPVGNFR